MTKIKTIFAGTPSFSVPTLEYLLSRKDIDVLGVYTRPDKPKGRGRQLAYSKVKSYAIERKLNVFQPASFKEEKTIIKFQAFKADLFIVAAYGIILPTTIIEAARNTINVHASLLPRWRGAAPIQRSIINGDRKTGISIMRIVEELDAGPVINAIECKIEESDNCETLTRKLSTLAPRALAITLQKIIDNKVTESPQKLEKVTYAEKIKKNERTINWMESAEKIVRKIRALSPTPGASTKVKELDLKIIDAQITSSDSKDKVGDLFVSSDGFPAFYAGDKAVKILKIKISGKNTISGKDFYNGYRQLFGT